MPHELSHTPLHVDAGVHTQTSQSPELRRDPVTGRWVVIAPERARRPVTLTDAEPRHRVEVNGERVPCPFCPGQEHDTPNEVLAYREPGTAANGPGWRLRVVPNKFPAVRPIQADFTLISCAGSEQTPVPPSLFHAIPGFGRHEVLIECAEHVATPQMLPDAAFGDVFRAYRDRLLTLAQEPRLRYAVVFKNVGAEAGATLEHTHSQIVALPLVPESIEQELGGAEEYHARHGRCVFCDLLTAELAAGTRVVAESPQFVALAPFAPRFAFEVWVLPRAHDSGYEATTDAQAAELAVLIKRVLRAFDAVLGNPAYNWFLHTAPLRSTGLRHFHWHFELIPRTSRPAGLEWGSGCFVNAVSPEAAAEQLRAAAR